MIIFLSITAPTLLAAILGAVAWTGRKITDHGETLAAIRQQLDPPGGASLRFIVDGNSTRIAVIESEVSTLKYKPRPDSWRPIEST